MGRKCSDKIDLIKNLFDEYHETGDMDSIELCIKIERIVYDQ